MKVKCKLKHLNIVNERMGSQFYMNLPSNSSMQFYPKNKTSNYITKLPKRLQLDGEWEVGLVEIKYPHTWYNIREGKNGIEIYQPGRFKQLNIKAGYYKNVPELIKYINKEVDFNHDLNVKFAYDDISKRVKVKCVNDATIILHSDVARILGFVTGLQIKSSLTEGYTLALSDTGNHYFYVYIDIIQGQYYGDVVVPIIQTVKASGKHGSYVSRRYEKPQYVPLNKSEFDTIDINIRDEVGDLVAFEHGKVNITLHFRRSKTHYYIYI